jgi:hypothetical protein
LPKKAIFRPARYQHMVSIIRFNERKEFAGNGSNSRDFGDLGSQGLRDGPPKQLGRAPPNRQIDGLLLDALLHVLVGTAGKPVQGNKAADRDGHPERCKQGARGPSS